MVFDVLDRVDCATDCVLLVGVFEVVNFGCVLAIAKLGCFDWNCVIVVVWVSSNFTDSTNSGCDVAQRADRSDVVSNDFDREVDSCKENRMD